MDRILGVDADHVLDLADRLLGVGRREVDLVQHGNHFHALLDRGVAVGHGLGFHALGGIHHKQGAFAGRQRTADLVGKVDVAGRVDQVHCVHLAVASLVTQSGRLCLDRNPALALEVHRVEDLRLHFAVGKAAAELDKAIRQRRLAVVDVRDDRKVADEFLGHG